MRILVVAALAAVLSAAGARVATPGPGAAARRLDGLEQAVAGRALPPGWAVRAVRGARPPRTEVVIEAGVPVLRFEAAGEAAWFWQRVDPPLDAAEGLLHWRWAVDTAVDGAAFGDPARDDAPARVFVVFGRPGPLARPRALFYSWGAEDPAGTTFRGRAGGRIGVVVVRDAGAPRREWVHDVRDPAADYRALFGGEPPAIAAVGFMIDTDDTGRRAVSRLGSIAWEAHATVR